MKNTNDKILSMISKIYADFTVNEKYDTAIQEIFDAVNSNTVKPKKLDEYAKTLNEIIEELKNNTVKQFHWCKLVLKSGDVLKPITKKDMNFNLVKIGNYIALRCDKIVIENLKQQFNSYGDTADGKSVSFTNIKPYKSLDIFKVVKKTKNAITAISECNGSVIELIPTDFEKCILPTVDIAFRLYLTV